MSLDTLEYDNHYPNVTANNFKFGFIGEKTYTRAFMYSVKDQVNNLSGVRRYLGETEAPTYQEIF